MNTFCLMERFLNAKETVQISAMMLGRKYITVTIDCIMIMKKSDIPTAKLLKKSEKYAEKTIKTFISRCFFVFIGDFGEL